MKKIFTTKISLQSHNPTFSYPIVRLPRELKELAGQIVDVYETETDGVKGFFVVPHLAKLAKSNKSVEHVDEGDLCPKYNLIDQCTLKTNGLGRIRTGDLRRVKAEVLEIAESFLHARPESSEASVGAITTKNASVPLCIV